MSIHLLFYRDLSPNAARHTPVPAEMTELEKQAVDRVRRAGVDAPTSAILSWIRSAGPDAILRTRLCDIRAVANAF